MKTRRLKILDIDNEKFHVDVPHVVVAYANNDFSSVSTDIQGASSTESFVALFTAFSGGQTVISQQTASKLPYNTYMHDCMAQIALPTYHGTNVAAGGVKEYIRSRIPVDTLLSETAYTIETGSPNFPLQLLWAIGEDNFSDAGTRNAPAGGGHTKAIVITLS